MRQVTTRVKTAKKRKTSSTKWLQRQLNDDYVALSKKDGFRSRAAYKLLEIDNKFNIIKNNINCVDLGAAPGGWTQVLISKIQDPSKIITLDLLEMDPIAGVKHLKGDFCDQNIVEELKLLQPETDLILSDMAPNTTGHKQTDHLRIMDLCERVFYFSDAVLNKGGSVIIKIFQGGAANDLLKIIKEKFSEVQHYKPPASRKGSTEIYLIAKNYKGKNEN